MVPRILIFSIAMGAEYLSYVKSIATFALKFFVYIISVLASVIWLYRCTTVQYITKVDGLGLSQQSAAKHSHP